MKNSNFGYIRVPSFFQFIIPMTSRPISLAVNYFLIQSLQKLFIDQVSLPFTSHSQNGEVSKIFITGQLKDNILMCNLNLNLIQVFVMKLKLILAF